MEQSIPPTFEFSYIHFLRREASRRFAISMVKTSIRATKSTCVKLMLSLPGGPRTLSMLENIRLATGSSHRPGALSAYATERSASGGV